VSAGPRRPCSCEQRARCAGSGQDRRAADVEREARSRPVVAAVAAAAVQSRAAVRVGAHRVAPRCVGGESLPQRRVAGKPQRRRRVAAARVGATAPLSCRSFRPCLCFCSCPYRRRCHPSSCSRQRRRRRCCRRCFCFYCCSCWPACRVHHAAACGSGCAARAQRYAASVAGAAGGGAAERVRGGDGAERGVAQGERAGGASQSHLHAGVQAGQWRRRRRWWWWERHVPSRRR
jgi:hypothetical protein